MKKIFLATAGLFFIMVSNAQLRWRPPNITRAVDSCRKTNGAVLLRQDGTTKLYATFKNSKVSEYYATDGNGKRIEPTYSAAKTGVVTCTVCISVWDPYKKELTKMCYEVDCKNLPPPTKAMQ